MATSKDIILTAIHFKGIEKVKASAKQLAEDSLVTVGYVKAIIREVERGQIVIK